jgi:hypothetical protein
VKSELADLILTQEASWKHWDGGMRNSVAANFAKALRW